jgi:thioredoxin reductase/NAD-dependent dihydropyrimidine dehydrogenase PreA subunit
MVTLLTYAAFLLVLVGAIALHLRRTRARETQARAAAEKGKLHSGGPRAQHPLIDVAQCIGCASCVDACPEGDVLAVIGGKAAIANPHKCIGHGLCAEACPVGAITIVMADPSISADMPRLTPEYETSVPNMFIVGELGGLALIKNAVAQGQAVIDTIARRLERAGARRPAAGVHDVCIVGAGPGGISASLRAIERGVDYLTLEQDEFGGTIAKFPRQKLVMTSPVEIPLYGRFKKLEISKEELLAFWTRVSQRADLHVRTKEKVESIVRGADGLFDIETTRARLRARHVVLALGRRGTPRKLGITGEEMGKVMYGLIDAEAYKGAKILVVGGGDSAVEAALGLAHQKGNEVTLSYRGAEFSRIKERNAQRIREAARKGSVRVVFNSNPVEVRPKSVVLEIQGTKREIPNDYVWIFAGGQPPNAFLEKVGVAIGPRDMTGDARAEARRAGAAA